MSCELDLHSPWSRWILPGAHAECVCVSPGLSITLSCLWRWQCPSCPQLLQQIQLPACQSLSRRGQTHWWMPT